jgi:hypothetical protein
MKRLFTCFLILSAALTLPPILVSKADYEVQGKGAGIQFPAPKPPQIEAIMSSGYYEGEQFSQSEIDAFLSGSTNYTILQKLIQCESQNTNREEIDSNGKMSRGILQFQDSTWATFAALANVSSSPMNPVSAIKVADFMIDRGELHRWSCARILKLL